MMECDQRAEFTFGIAVEQNFERAACAVAGAHIRELLQWKRRTVDRGPDWRGPAAQAESRQGSPGLAKACPPPPRTLRA